MRSWAPFCSGWLGAMRCWAIPSRIHQTFIAHSPWMPVEQKGAPLSVRIARGRPTSRKSRSNTSQLSLRADRSEGVTRQQIAAVLVGDRQGIAVRAIAGAEVALDVR